ncbi:MAG: efflux RND transporter periplasmic adaptor subunit [Planctomycetota bacterium]
MNPAPNRATLKWRILISAILVVLFLAAGDWLFERLQSLKRPPQQAAFELRRPAVQTRTVFRGPYRERLTGYGKARALRQAQVASEVAGLVAWVSPGLEAGGDIEAGAELVRIDPRDLQNAVTRASADERRAEAMLSQAEVEQAGIISGLEIARSELATSREELARAEELLGEGITSPAERDQQHRATRLLERQVLQLESSSNAAVPKVESARADLERAQVVLRQAELDLKRTVIRAPYAGRIESRSAEPGARVAPGTLLFEIIDLSRIEVPVSLPASRIADVQPGSKVEIRLEEGGSVAWSGTVSRVSPAVDDQNRTFQVFVVVAGSNLESTVPPGTFVVATVDGRLHQEVFQVPRIAFLNDTVYVAVPELGEAGHAVAQRRTPVVSRWLPGVALVTDGLDEGDRVVITNLERIADASQILIEEGGDPQAAGSPMSGGALEGVR